MIKVLKLLELSNGALINKTVCVGELLIRINSKNILIRKREDKYFWMMVLPDEKCRLNWLSGGYTAAGLAQARARGNIVALDPGIKYLILHPATRDPRQFIDVIEEIGEDQIIAELENMEKAINELSYRR